MCISPAAVFGAMGDAHGGEANAAAPAPSSEMLFDAAKFERDDVGRGNVSPIAERCEGDDPCCCAGRLGGKERLKWKFMNTGQPTTELSHNDIEKNLKPACSHARKLRLPLNCLRAVAFLTCRTIADQLPRAAI
jgi:hypothetical protein